MQNNREIVELYTSIATVENPSRFPGQYYDQETGLHYNYFRYYNPQTGRYITPDPIGLEGGINLFAYVGGNPVASVDPLGLRSGYRGIKGLAMRFGEIRRKKAVDQFFDKWGKYICDAANANNVDPIMLFAIFKEEISHMWPPGEGWAEVYLGWGESVGPGQIRADIWSDQLQADRDALTDIYTNIQGTAEVLKTEKNTLLRWRSLGNISPETWASRYNRGPKAYGVTDYGLRVGGFYNELKAYVNNKCSKKCE